MTNELANDHQELRIALIALTVDETESDNVLKNKKEHTHIKQLIPMYCNIYFYDSYQ